MNGFKKKRKAEKERGKLKDSDLDSPGVTDIFFEDGGLAIVFLPLCFCSRT